MVYNQEHRELNVIHTMCCHVDNERKYAVQTQSVDFIVPKQPSTNNVNRTYVTECMKRYATIISATDRPWGIQMLRNGVQMDGKLQSVILNSAIIRPVIVIQLPQRK